MYNNQDVYSLEKFLKDFLYLEKSENFHEILLKFDFFKNSLLLYCNRQFVDKLSIV